MEIGNIDQLREICMGCTKCRLSETRTKVVFGEGNEDADIMFVGEGPGYYEDQSGRPFVGKAGQLLDKMLDAIEFKREDVYIANIVKCRPPNNRNPKEDEAKMCLDYLRYQVKFIKPKIIVCLGSVASRYIIDKDFKITRERGQWIHKGNIDMIATFHPSALLRDESKKKFAWEDFKQIRDKLKELEESD